VSTLCTACPLRSNFASYSLCNLWARWVTVWPTCGTLALSSAVSIAHTTSQTGNFEPPFSVALERFVTAHDNHTDPTKVALRRMEERALQAEKRVSTEDVARKWRLLSLFVRPYLAHSGQATTQTQRPEMSRLLQTLSGLCQPVAVHQ
jgi:hypothetical protein